MEFRSHIQLTGRALGRWFLAQCLDSVCVAFLWLIGLLIIGVPWAPFWAFLAAGFHFIPHFGPLLSLLGPLCAALIEGLGWMGLLKLLCVYAIIMVVDGFVLQPLIMRRTAKVPFWASLFVPLVFGYFFSFWGVLLAAPALAVFYAFRARHREMRQLPPPVEIIPPEIEPPRRNREPQPPIIEG